MPLSMLLPPAAALLRLHPESACDCLAAALSSPASAMPKTLGEAPVKTLALSRTAGLHKPNGCDALSTVVRKGSGQNRTT